MVGDTGLEPACLSAIEPKSIVSSISTNPLYVVLAMGLEPIRYCYQRIFLLLYVTIALIHKNRRFIQSEVIKVHTRYHLKISIKL